MNETSERSAEGRQETVRLDAASIDAIAMRLAEILRSEQASATAQLITAADVASRFGVSRTWVYDNAVRLGAIRLGSGSKARLRFDRDQVEALIEGAKRARRSERPAPARRWVDEADLIPIRGQ